VAGTAGMATGMEVGITAGTAAGTAAGTGHAVDKLLNSLRDWVGIPPFLFPKHLSKSCSSNSVLHS